MEIYEEKHQYWCSTKTEEAFEKSKESLAKAQSMGAALQQ